MPNISFSFGYIFSPFQTADIHILKSHWALFVKVIARELHARKLLSDNHPAVIAGTGGLTNLLKTATISWLSQWSAVVTSTWAASAHMTFGNRLLNLAKETGPEMVASASAVAMGWSLLASVSLGGLWIALNLLVSTAHAASNSDLARTMLSDMLPFLNQGGSSTGQLAQAVGKMSAVMSLVAFYLAGVQVLWCSLLLLVDYTTSPENAKSRYSPVMFVIRIAIAIGLLVPIKDGWSGSQIIVAQLAMYGSDKATEAWSQGASYLADSGQWLSRPGVAKADVANLTAGILLDEACEAIWNTRQPEKGEDGVDFQIQDTFTNDGVLAYDLRTTNAWYGQMQGLNLESAHQCGSIRYNVSSSAVSDIVSAHKSTAEATRQRIKQYLADSVGNLWKCLSTDNGCFPLDQTKVAEFVNSFYTDIDSKIGASFNTSKSTLTAKLKNAGTNQGWVGAGAWLNTISNLQGQLAEAGAATPTVEPPRPLSGKYADPLLASALDHSRAWVDNGMAAAMPFHAPDNGSVAGTNAAWHNASDGMWTHLFEITDADPLAQVSSLGYAMYYSGAALWAATTVVSGGTSSLAGRSMDAAAKLLGMGATVGSSAVMSGLGKLADTISPITNAIALTLFIVGLSLAYLVPALPLIRFMFSVLQWLINVVEVVLLVPVMLVLMITAESGGLLGPTAKAGFWLIIGMIVRPILTIIGFVVGIVMLSTAVKMVNALLWPWVRDFASGGYVSGLGPIGFVAFAVIYMVIIYGFVNTISKFPETLPAAAHRWIGANAGGERDDGAAISGVAASVTNRLMQRMPRSTSPR